MVARLTIFTTRSSHSAALSEAITRSAKTIGFDCIETPQPSQEAVVAACLGDGALVFDATIEPDGSNIYSAAMYVLLSIDYSLVVSRTYLPANFLGVRRGVAPPYPETCDNAALLPRIETQLADLRKRVPRPAEHMGPNAASALEDDALARARARRHSEGQIFISHRGQWASDVEELAAHSLERFGVDVRVFRTGELAFSDEIMTLLQRWAVLRELQRWIVAAEEFWIYRTQDYSQSWWTRGELVLVANAHPASKPRVRVVNPGGEIVVEYRAGDIPSLSKVQRDRLTELLYFAHQPEWLFRKQDGIRIFRMLTGQQASRDLFKPSFRKHPLLHCSVCVAALEQERQPFDFDIGRFLSSKPPGLYPLPDATLGAGDKVVTCPGCSSEYRISLGPARYWWYPVRNGVGTGPDGLYLEERPSYRSTLLSAKPLRFTTKAVDRLGRFLRRR